MNGTALNLRRVYYANNSKNHTRSDYNCWGATLFVLGRLQRLRWIDGMAMRWWLETNTIKIYRPRKQGDIVAFYRFGLEHTAVYLGKGRYFHKRGRNLAQITTLAGIRETYSGDIEFLRVKG